MTTNCLSTACTAVNLLEQIWSNCSSNPIGANLGQNGSNSSSKYLLAALEKFGVVGEKILESGSR